MKKLLLIIFLSLAFTGLSYADYKDGMNAYNRGDFKSAFNEWKPLALKGNAKAQAEIAAMYGNGDYVVESWSQAAYWYQKAADQGEPRAQVNLGLMYLAGTGVSKSKLKGTYLINEAIDSRHPQVMLMRELLTSLGFDL